MVRVEIENESVIGGRPARVLVYEDKKLVVEVEGEVHLRPGADGGYYHCVTLKKKGGDDAQG